MIFLRRDSSVFRLAMFQRYTIQGILLILQRPLVFLENLSTFAIPLRENHFKAHTILTIQYYGKGLSIDW